MAAEARPDRSRSPASSSSSAGHSPPAIGWPAGQASAQARPAHRPALRRPRRDHSVSAGGAWLRPRRCVASSSACGRGVRASSTSTSVAVRCVEPVDQVDRTLRPIGRVAELRLVDQSAQSPRGPARASRPRRHLRSRRRAASSRAARDRGRAWQADASAAPADRPARSRRRRRRPARAAAWRAACRQAARRPESSMSMSQRRSSAATRARQVAVGRDQRGGSARRLQRLAQGERDHQRLLLRRGAVGARHMIERGRGSGARPGRRWSRPAASARRSAGGARIAGRRARPVGDLARARSRARPASSRRPNCGWVGSSVAQLCLVHVAVEAGQHDGALRQPRDDGQQLARRRLRAGRAGGDHRRRWAARSRQRAAWARIGACAPVERVDLAALGQDRRPMPRRRWRGTPACAASGWRSCRRPALRAGRTARRRWRARRAGRPARGRASAPAPPTGRSARPGRRLNAATSCASSASRSAADRWRAAGRARRRRQSTVSQSPSSRSPSGASRGSRVGLPSAARRKASRKRAHRAPRRQQDQRIGQRQRIAAMLGQHARRQLVGEAAVDADGEDALHRQHPLGFGQCLRRADMEPVAVMDEAVEPAEPPRRGSTASAARTGRRASRGTGRASQIDTLAKM